MNSNPVYTTSIKIQEYNRNLKDVLSSVIKPWLLTLYNWCCYIWCLQYTFCFISLGILQTMGNDNAKMNVINRSSSNVRAFITQEKLDVEAFITKCNDQIMDILLPHSAIKTFCFRPDVPSYRILVSENGELPWEKNQHISLFIEDEDDKEICIKHICLCMPLPYAASIFIYDIWWDRHTVCLFLFHYMTVILFCCNSPLSLISLRQMQL